MSSFIAKSWVAHLPCATHRLKQKYPDSCQSAPHSARSERQGANEDAQQECSGQKYRQQHSHADCIQQPGLSLSSRRKLCSSPAPHVEAILPQGLAAWTCNDRFRALHPFLSFPPSYFVSSAVITGCYSSSESLLLPKGPLQRNRSFQDDS